MINSELLLFIEPKNFPSKNPVIDDLTKKMTAALRKGKKSDFSMGWHTCSCGADSDCCNFLLTNNEITNSLCIHYLAYHREEIPQEQLNRVKLLNDGEKDPTEEELGSNYIKEFYNKKQKI